MTSKNLHRLLPLCLTTAKTEVTKKPDAIDHDLAFVMKEGPKNAKVLG